MPRPLRWIAAVVAILAIGALATQDVVSTSRARADIASARAEFLARRGAVNSCRGAVQVIQHEGVAMNVMLTPLCQFAMGYAVILAVPGPNVLTLGALAALRGMRSAVPVCLGMATGASLLAGSIAMANGIAPHSSLTHLVQALGAAAVVFIAYRLMTRGPRPSTPPSAAPLPLAEFSMGFCTAATNPITAGYFAVQFAGPMAEGPGSMLVAAIAVSVMSFAVMLGLCGPSRAPVGARARSRVAPANSRWVGIVSRAHGWNDGARRDVMIEDPPSNKPALVRIDRRTTVERPDIRFRRAARHSPSRWLCGSGLWRGSR